MKLIAFSLSLAFVLLACGPPPQPEVKPSPEPEPQAEVKETPPAQEDPLIEAFKAQLSQGDYEGLRKHFNEELQGALSAEVLQQVFQEQVGTLEEILGYKILQAEQATFARVIITTLKGSKGIRYLKLQESADGGLVGINLFDVEASPECEIEALPEGLREEEVVFMNDTWPITGALLLPDGPGPFPVVLLIQGTGKGDRDSSIACNKPMRDIALGLAGAGIASFRMDKALSFHEHATVQEIVVDDALAAIEGLKSREDLGKVFVLGHSQGGQMLPEIASLSPHLSGGVILAGPTRGLAETLQEQLSQGKSDDLPPEVLAYIESVEALIPNLDSAELSASTPPEMLPLNMSAQYVLSMRGYDPAARAAALEIPLLILQGEKDIQVTPKDFEGWKARLGEEATYLAYPMLNHLFMEVEGESTGAEYSEPAKVSPEVTKDINGWLKGLL